MSWRTERWLGRRCADLQAEIRDLKVQLSAMTERAVTAEGRLAELEQTSSV